MRTNGSALRSLLVLNVAVHVAAQTWAGGTPPPPSMPSSMMAATPAPAPQYPAPSAIPATDASALAAEIIAGEVIGFLNETNPPIEELNCIKFGATEISRAVVETSEHVVDLLQQMFGSRRLDSERRLLPPGEEGGGTASIVPDLKQSMIDVINMVHGRTFDCLHAQGIADFKLAAKHLSDLHFMQRALLANGADISYELTSAIQSWREQKYFVFGGFLGQAWRRVLLGSPHSAGMVAPPDFAIQQMTNGLLQGFFGNGFEMKLGVTRNGMMQEADISLHDCIAENMMFFRSAWGAIAGMMTGLRQSVHGVKLTPAEQAAAGKKEQAALAQALISLPGAMQRCSTSTGQTVNLKQALGAFEDGRMSLQLPPRKAGVIDLSVDLTAALKSWTDHDFSGFGFRLGRLLQRFALLAFPQKYSVDTDGGLRRVVGDWSNTTAAGAPLGLISLGVVALGVVLSFTWLQRKVTKARDTTYTGVNAPLQRESLEEMESMTLEKGRDCNPIE